MTSPTFPYLPDSCLVVLIGASGAGKSTLAATWPASQVLSLDALRETVSDDAGDQDATGEAVAALHLFLEARMRRRRFTVVDATNVTPASRAPLVAAAKRHNMPAVTVVFSTPASVCVERQGPRPANRTVPDDTVRAQHTAMVRSHSKLLAEGFNEVHFSDSLCQLQLYLQRLGDARKADLGLDGGDGLGEMLLVRRVFGAEVLPLWRWKPGSTAAGGDRVAEIRLGQQYLTLAFRPNVDGQGDYGFDVALPCPHDDEWTSWAWAPAYSVTCLARALNGELDDSEDIICTVHGPNTGHDQDDEEQEQPHAEAVRA
ncbi:AAA family ATPase [Streptomyces lavendulae]|uniref:AAA family ATPase n=1 Tax=Streptomyces lavendulae TaxID=1914 RepID=UPI0037F1B746